MARALRRHRPALTPFLLHGSQPPKQANVAATKRTLVGQKLQRCDVRRLSNHGAVCTGRSEGVKEVKRLFGSEGSSGEIPRTHRPPATATNRSGAATVVQHAGI